MFCSPTPTITTTKQYKAKQKQEPLPSNFVIFTLELVQVSVRCEKKSFCHILQLRSDSDGFFTYVFSLHAF